MVPDCKTSTRMIAFFNSSSRLVVCFIFKTCPRLVTFVQHQFLYGSPSLSLFLFDSKLKEMSSRLIDHLKFISRLKNKHKKTKHQFPSSNLTFKSSSRLAVHLLNLIAIDISKIQLSLVLLKIQLSLVFPEVQLSLTSCSKASCY